jgi:hypothetical protein
MYYKRKTTLLHLLILTMADNGEQMIYAVLHVYKSDSFECPEAAHMATMKRNLDAIYKHVEKATIALDEKGYEYKFIGPYDTEEEVRKQLDQHVHEIVTEFTKNIRDGRVKLPIHKVSDPRSVYAMLSCSGTTHHVLCPLDVYMSIKEAYEECFGTHDIKWKMGNGEDNEDLSNDINTAIFVNRHKRIHVRICSDREMEAPTKLEALPLLVDMIHSSNDKDIIKFTKILQTNFVKYSTRQISFNILEVAKN